MRHARGLKHMNEVDHDAHVDPAGGGLGVDPVDLVAVAIDERHPGPLVAGVAAVGLGEDLTHHGGGVVDDAGSEPLVSSLRSRGGLVSCVGEDVRGGAGHGGDVVDGADFGHALAVAFLAF